MHLPTIEITHELDLPSAPLWLDLSNDGRYLAVALMGPNQSGLIRVYRTSDGELRGEHIGGGGDAKGVAFVGGGNRLAYLVEESDESRVGLLDLDTGESHTLARFPGSEVLLGLRRSTEGKFLVTEGLTTHVWEMTTGSLLWTTNNSSRSATCFGPAENDLYLYDRGEVHRIDAFTGEYGQSWEAPSEAGAHVRVSPNGRLLVAVGSGFRGVFAIDINTSHRIHSEYRDVFDDTYRLDEELNFASCEFVPTTNTFVLTGARSRWFGLPRFEDLGTVSLSKGQGAFCSTVARTAPVFAFTLARDLRLVIVRIVQEKPS